MGELMRAMRLPAIDMMMMAVENKRLREELEASRAANAVLTEELSIREREREIMLERMRAMRQTMKVLRDERNDARHERDCLRARRDEAYTQAIVGNRKAARRWQKTMRRMAAEALCLAVTLLLLFVLGSKAISWIRYWMG